MADYWYDEAAAEAAVAFFPAYLTFTKGEWAGKPFHLEPWEADRIIRPLFGWKRADGTRRYRKCIVWLPRKNGKTELAAGISHLALLGDAEPGAEVYAIAKDKAQASLVFNIASQMAAASPALSALLEIWKTSIYCPATNGSFKPLTGASKGKHGLNMSGLIGDEVHEWPSGDLYTFVHQSSVSRRQPIEFLISTAGQKLGYGYELWDYCQKVIDGTIEDEETLIVIFAADAEDDWTSPDVWRKANPNFGISVKESYLAAECAKAMASPRLENDFKRYHLNIWTEQAVRWLPMHLWDACKGADDWKALAERLRGKYCYAGLDLSQKIDLTAEVLTFPPQPGLDRWAFVPRFFVPKDRIEERVKTDRVPYDRWLKAGALFATPGNVIDYDFIKAQILEDARTYEIRGVGCDPFNAMQLMIQLNGEGLNAVEVRQGFLTLSGPCKELEAFVISQKAEHGAHPVLRWCASNVAIDQDAAGNIKPNKAKSAERIDGIAGAVTGLAMALAEKPPQSKTPELYIL